jgi:hypothetical protein
VVVGGQSTIVHCSSINASTSLQVYLVPCTVVCPQFNSSPADPLIEPERETYLRIY